MEQIKSQLISGQIIAFVMNGATLKEAFEYVLGPGYYDCLIEELYLDLRAKNGMPND